MWDHHLRHANATASGAAWLRRVLDSAIDFFASAQAKQNFHSARGFLLRVACWVFRRLPPGLGVSKHAVLHGCAVPHPLSFPRLLPARAFLLCGFCLLCCGTIAPRCPGIFVLRHVFWDSRAVSLVQTIPRLLQSASARFFFGVFVGWRVAGPWNEAWPALPTHNTRSNMVALCLGSSHFLRCSTRPEHKFFRILFGRAGLRDNFPARQHDSLAHKQAL
jgi:hypothetical protein